MALFIKALFESISIMEWRQKIIIKANEASHFLKRKGEKFLSTFLKPYLVLLLTIAPQRMLHSMTHTLTSQGGKSQATEAPPPLPPPLPPPPPLVPASVGWPAWGGIMGQECERHNPHQILRRAPHLLLLGPGCLRQGIIKKTVFLWKNSKIPW